MWLHAFTYKIPTKKYVEAYRDIRAIDAPFSKGDEKALGY
jgi:hypothetical protein